MFPIRLRHFLARWSHQVSDIRSLEHYVMVMLNVLNPKTLTCFALHSFAE